MPNTNKLRLPKGNAICYSGYRAGQDPRKGIYPSEEQVLEDLLILASNWQVLRVYDCSPHAEIVLRLIKRHDLNFKVMLGVDMAAEVSNPNCPWGAEFSDEQLAANKAANASQIDKLITLTQAYSDIVFAVSVGNEASVDWTDHLVPVDSLIEYVRQIKASVTHPVTFCENYVPWIDKLKPLAAELDFISIHSYPVWEYKRIEEALQYTRENYNSVASEYPDMPVVITEAGWPTASNGRGIEDWNASQELQAAYYPLLQQWTASESILTFVFEAFDEPWKGSDHPHEPEKHWGLFKSDRTPKLVMQGLYLSPI